MSDDEKAAKELVETLRDGEQGFAAAAEKLRDSDHAEWASILQRLSEQRAEFRREIVASVTRTATTSTRAAPPRRPCTAAGSPSRTPSPVTTRAPSSAPR